MIPRLPGDGGTIAASGTSTRQRHRIALGFTRRGRKRRSGERAVGAPSTCRLFRRVLFAKIRSGFSSNWLTLTGTRQPAGAVNPARGIKPSLSILSRLTRAREARLDPYCEVRGLVADNPRRDSARSRRRAARPDARPRFTGPPAVVLFAEGAGGGGGDQLRGREPARTGSRLWVKMRNARSEHLTSEMTSLAT